MSQVKWPWIRSILPPHSHLPPRPIFRTNRLPPIESGGLLETEDGAGANGAGKGAANGAGKGAGAADHEGAGASGGGGGGGGSGGARFGAVKSRRKSPRPFGERLGTKWKRDNLDNLDQGIRRESTLRLSPQDVARGGAGGGVGDRGGRGSNGRKSLENIKVVSFMEAPGELKLLRSLSFKSFLSLTLCHMSFNFFGGEHMTLFSRQEPYLIFPSNFLV